MKTILTLGSAGGLLHCCTGVFRTKAKSGQVVEKPQPMKIVAPAFARVTILRRLSVAELAKRRERLAGALGFEPRYGGTKNRCLTTWRRPNRAGVFSEGSGGVQGAYAENFAFPARLAGRGSDR